MVNFNQPCDGFTLDLSQQYSSNYEYSICSKIIRKFWHSCSRYVVPVQLSHIFISAPLNVIINKRWGRCEHLDRCRMRTTNPWNLNNKLFPCKIFNIHLWLKTKDNEGYRAFQSLMGKIEIHTSFSLSYNFTMFSWFSLVNTSNSLLLISTGLIIPMLLDTFTANVSPVFWLEKESVICKGRS